MDLASLLKQPEGKTLEFKRDLSSPHGVLKTIVAFANTSGGVLLIGVEDGTRHIRGVSAPLEVEERLVNVIADGVQPRLMPDIEILPWRRTNVIGVEVHPSSARPHHVQREGADGGVYVRVGSTNRRADPDLVGEIKRFARGESFDEQAMPDLDSEAIDFRVASESFAPVRRLQRKDLETLRLVAGYQRRFVPTIGGVLLFGKDMGRHFPDAWIQAGRFGGVDKSVIADRLEIRLPLASAVEAALDFVRKHSIQSAAIGSGRRKDRWNLPPVAVREAVVNAVVHADYSQRGAPIRISIFDDRLEVENPGLLPFGLTIDDLQRGVSKLRNRVIGRVFHELGLIEQWGSGVQRMASACRAAGLDAPVFEEIGHRFRVTIRTVRTHETLVDDTDRAILDTVAAPDGRSTREVAEAIGLTTRATRTRLMRLMDRGLVRVLGSGPNDPNRRFFSTETP
ncbi:MAG: putative DNA binding domain-containing protein [Burkholderiales bacterium]|nr:putative DNA binding domain-containing protein [Burkholderiales bacterium]